MGIEEGTTNIDDQVITYSLRLLPGALTGLGVLSIFSPTFESFDYISRLIIYTCIFLVILGVLIASTEVIAIIIQAQRRLSYGLGIIFVAFPFIFLIVAGSVLLSDSPFVSISGQILLLILTSIMGLEKSWRFLLSRGSSFLNSLSRIQFLSRERLAISLLATLGTTSFLWLPLPIDFQILGLISDVLGIATILVSMVIFYIQARNGRFGSIALPMLQSTIPQIIDIRSPISGTLKVSNNGQAPFVGGRLQIIPSISHESTILVDNVEAGGTLNVSLPNSTVNQIGQYRVELRDEKGGIWGMVTLTVASFD